jgi:hypothetical protein
MRWCDFNCEHAGFPDPELLGACRTLAAVFCKKLERVVPKHTACPADPAPADTTAGKEDGSEGRPAGGPP